MQYLRNVATLKLNQDLCTGCRMCTIVCPRAVFEMREKKARILDLNDCMECGACALNCKSNAITVRAGVGCASGVLNGILNGTEPTCDCSDSTKNCC
ncbi:MAG TPA: mercury methylation ferredoxin HgcB [Bacteroidales bacterium]|nr:mercury methylation ferredoxin HgcB [Bacteroidales bacterium]